MEKEIIEVKITHNDGITVETNLKKEELILFLENILDILILGKEER